VHEPFEFPESKSGGQGGVDETFADSEATPEVCSQ